MADAKISALTALTGANLATGDVLAVEDISAATTKKITADELRQAAVFTDYFLQKLAGGATIENLGAVESAINTVAATGSTETLDTSLYGVHDCTMDQACTFTFSNPAPSGKFTCFILILRGAFTPTFPTLKWGDATVPTYTTPSRYVFTTVDAGSTWMAKQIDKAIA